MLFKDYYKILGLETNKVTEEEIKNAFREQAKKYHPDISKESISEEKFKDINEAYRKLSDSSQKRKYDRIWYTHVGRKKEKVEDRSQREKNTNFLEILFGNRQEKNEQKEKKQIKKGENVETAINVSIEEAFYGLSKKISLRAVDGKMKSFTITIPAGIRNGEKVRLIGQGKPGKNGGKNGDLFIKINIENSSKYKLEGYDIKTDLYITPWEAALGTKLLIDAIDENISIYVPQGSGSGEKIEIPEKGYKDGKGGRGSLIAEIKIVVPKKLTKEEITLFKKLKEISKYEPRNTKLDIKV